MRIYELAKKIGVPSKVILNELELLGIEGKTHSSGIEPAVARKLESVFLERKSEAKKPPVVESETVDLSKQLKRPPGTVTATGEMLRNREGNVQLEGGRVGEERFNLLESETSFDHKNKVVIFQYHAVRQNPNLEIHRVHVRIHTYNNHEGPEAYKIIPGRNGEKATLGLDKKGRVTVFINVSCTKEVKDQKLEDNGWTAKGIKWVLPKLADE